MPNLESNLHHADENVATSCTNRTQSVAIPPDIAIPLSIVTDAQQLDDTDSLLAIPSGASKQTGSDCLEKGATLGWQGSNGPYKPDPEGKDAKSRAKANAQDVNVTTGNTPQMPCGVTSQTHKNKLSTLSSETIEARGYATVTDSPTLEAMGFPASMNPALLIPGFDVHGERRGPQLRPDVPLKVRGKEQKYLFSKAHKNFLDIPQRCRADIGNPSIPFHIVEGAIKADFLADRGLCVGGIAGVTGWRWTNEDEGKTALACFDSIAIKGRVFYLVPDSDYKHKIPVRKAINALARYLEGRGARVFILEIPDAPGGGKQGPDDFFKAGGTVEQLHSFVALPGKSRPEVGKADAKSVGLEAAEGEDTLTDIGNGRLYAKQHQESLRFCSTDERWMFYKQGTWEADSHGEADRRAKATAEDFTHRAAKEEDDQKREKKLRHAVALTKRRQREIMVKDAASEPGMTVTLDEFDSNPDLFNCANGTLNLKTREFQPHNPKDLLTRKSPVNYDASATCPVWKSCTELWFPDAELAGFIQEMMGITLSGRIYEELFIFLYGPGNNGKSKFLAVIEFILGTYFHKTGAETIMQSRSRRSAGAPKQEILELRGARAVAAQEIDEKNEFNTAVIKDLTGRDTINARGVYAKRETTFQPQFTLWMYGNGKPKIQDSSEGMWRRPKLVDFGQPIPVDKRDPNLSLKLQNEAAGILNWALEGLKRIEDGNGFITTPDCVTTATEGYKEQQNPIKLFFEDKCFLGPERWATAADLFEAWRDWCRANCEEPGNQASFGVALEREELKPGRFYMKGKQVRGWKGVSLTDPEFTNEPGTEIEVGEI